MRNVFFVILAFALFAVSLLNASDTKVSALTALTEATIANDDEMLIIDTSATTSKRITMTELDKRYTTSDLTSAYIFVGDTNSASAAVAVSGDINMAQNGAVSIASGAVVNADVNASAAIAYSKLAALTDGNILVGNGSNVATSVNPSGDVDISNAGVFSIAAGVLVDADFSIGAVSVEKIEPITASRAIVTDAGGTLAASAVTATEVGYLDGVTSAIQTQIDTKPIKVGATDSLQTVGMLRATYDFSEDGGATGDISLTQVFPDNSVIKYCDLEVLTALASSGGSGTIAIKAEGANDILNAVDADTLTTGFNACIPNWSVANFKKTTAARTITATIGSEDLTAGKFIINCFYSESD